MKFKKNRSVFSPSILGFASFPSVAAMILSQSATAADGTWNTTTTGSLWSAPENWVGSIIADGSGFTADFNTLNPTADTTVNLDSARTIGNLIFGDTTPATAASWTVANNATPANILTLSVASGTPTVTVNTLGTNKVATISAVIDGTQGLRKSGPGTLALSAANFFTGGLTIDAGVVTTSNGTAGGAAASDVTLNGGRLNMANSIGNSINVAVSSALTLANNTFWTGQLKGGSGSTLTLNVGSTASPQGDWSAFAGTILFTGGNTFRANVSGGTSFGSANAVWDFASSTINISPRHSAGAASDITFRMGALQSTVSGMTLGSQANLPGAGRVVYEIGALNTNTTFLGTITENAAHKVAVTKIGTGTLALTAANTYTGGTTVSAGTLSIAQPALADGSTVSIGAAAVLALNFDETGGQVTDRVRTLIIDGVTKDPGVYGATGSGAVAPFIDDVHFSGPGTLTVASGNYASWADANGIPGEPATGDFDNDGLTNLVEYALGKSPTVSSQPPGTFTAGAITFTKGVEAIANDDVIYEIEESTDLGIGDPWAPAVTEGIADDTPTIVYTLPPGNPKQFARLKIVQTP